jgi:hypothetical protein
MTEIQGAAQAAIDAGWEIVRIVKGEKEPSGQWRNAKPKANDFQDRDQLAFKAGEPSGNRVCLDADCSEVIELLPRFVNMQNAWVEGRPSKPNSHWWVVAEDTPTRRFKDVDGATILEIISTGGYAVVPPSVNTASATPETRRWVEPRPALLQPVNPERFKLLAVCALLARHWPGQGSRHELIGPLTGLLLRCGVHPTNIPHLIEQAMHVAKDTSEIAVRMKYVENTIKRFSAGEHVTGGPKVAEILGREVKSRICSFLEAADFALLDELSQRWFICDVGADTVVGEEVEETDEAKARKWTRFSFRSFSSFRERLIKLPDIKVGERANGNPIMRPAADYWLEHPEAPQYDRLVYAPVGSGIDCDTAKNPPDLNGWKGFTVTPQSGDWSQTKNFIREIICDGDDTLFEWFLDWCAALFQRPGEHADTVPVLTGMQGTGKNFMFDKVLGWCFDGRHAATVVNLNGVLGDFNEKLSGLVLLTLDEVQLTPPQSVAMRGLVTGDTLDINRKHISRSAERNMLHIAILSNNVAPLKIDNDDRRFAFFAVSSAARKTTCTLLPSCLNSIRMGGGPPCYTSYSIASTTATACEERPALPPRSL